MEQKNRKKSLIIAFVTLIVLMFVCGAIFTIVKDHYDKEAQKSKYNLSQIDDYDKKLSSSETIQLLD